MGEEEGLMLLFPPPAAHRVRVNVVNVLPEVR